MSLPRVVAVAFLALALAGPASATYYTFTGTVVSTFHREDTTIVRDGLVNGLLPGSSVSYTFFADFSAPGEDGQQNPPDPYRVTYTTDVVFPNGNVADFGFATYYAGDALPIILLNGTLENRYNQFAVDFRTLAPSDANPAVAEFRLTRDAIDSFREIRMYSLIIKGICPSCLTALELGSSFDGGNSSDAFSGGVQTSDGVQSNLTLTRIAETPPEAVPEPASLLLLGGGLLGLTYLRRRR